MSDADNEDNAEEKDNVELAVEKALAKRDRVDKKRQREEEDNSASDEFGFSPKAVKSMENMANFFNTMKKVFANPLQDAVENKVGNLAANVVERAFSAPTAPQNRDIIDQILNSQFAAGLGAGLGQRGPEMVNTITDTFGKEKASKWLDDTISRGGGMGGRGMGNGGQGAGQVTGGSDAVAKQSEVDMILSLDPNNPEHVVAYAASQGGLPNDVARKMLMIHQDAFIKRMGRDGIRPGTSTENIQEYRGAAQEYIPPVQVNTELMSNNPANEDKRWENPELERVDGPSIANVGVDEVVKGENINVQKQNVDVIPQDLNNSKEVKQEQAGNVEQVSTNELTEYLKNLNNYVVGLKDAVEKQNNDMSSLRQELDIIKNAKGSDRASARELREAMGGVEVNAKGEINRVEGTTPTAINERERVELLELASEAKPATVVRSIKNIRKGPVKEDL